MKITRIGKIGVGQDGAVFSDLLFRFNAKGECMVYDLSQPVTGEEGNFSLVSSFVLDRSDCLAPHSNSVFFGREYFKEGDEFPLLYSNLYNNRRKEENRMEGLTCVYRIERKGGVFVSTLVQLIRIGFTDTPLWRSEKVEDKRPYGNFAIDGEKGIYYAFTMRDEEEKIRYFSFDLPRLSDGETDPEWGVKCVFLEEKDIKTMFDCAYQRYIQGAAFYKGQIYSLEGFTDDEKNPPAIKIISVSERKEKAAYLFGDFGLTIEPELIDFYKDKCIYADNTGNVYELEF